LFFLFCFFCFFVLFFFLNLTVEQIDTHHHFTHTVPTTDETRLQNFILNGHMVDMMGVAVKESKAASSTFKSRDNRELPCRAVST
jgi:hypothetical protein